MAKTAIKKAHRALGIVPWTRLRIVLSFFDQCFF